MPNRFLEQNKKISVSQIDLKLFLNFYEKYICKNIYTYILEDDTEIVVKFEENNFSHLLGLHKFKFIKDYKSSEKINEDIMNEKINFKELRISEENILKKDNELLDRITFFPILKTLLENTNLVLQYNINAVLNTKINFSFLLRSGKISVLVYLAVREINNNKKICVPVSLLVDRNNRFSKMKLKELKIKNITITKK